MIVFRIAVLLVLGLAWTGCTMSADGETAEKPTELKLENLLVQELNADFTPGREVIVSYVEIPPHTTMDRHWHPGEEFHYYLEGEVEIAIDGEPSIMGKAGEVGHIPYRKMHTAITKDKGAKALVFRVHTSGEPVRVLEEGEPQGQ